MKVALRRAKVRKFFLNLLDCTAAREKERLGRLAEKGKRSYNA